MRAGLYAYFQKATRTRWSAELKISGIMKNLPPDTKWVVIEFIEVSGFAFQAFADSEDIEIALDAVIRPITSLP